MATITINGITFTGRNINVIKNEVFIDGNKVETHKTKINISVHGNVDTLKVDACNNIQIDGYTKMVQTMSGDVNIKGSVEGNILTASGDVECGDVMGDVSTVSGDVECGAVSGSIKTVSGDVEHS